MKSLSTIEKEIERVDKRITESVSNFIQLIVVSITVVSILLGYLNWIPSSASTSTTLSTQLPIGFLLFIPLPIQILFMLILRAAYQWQEQLYIIRSLYQEIKNFSEYTDMPLYLDRESFTSRFMSMRSGHITARAVWYGIFILPISLYAIMLGYTFIEIYSQNHFLGVLYWCIYGFTSLWLLLGLIGLVYSFPNYSNQYREERAEIQGADALNRLVKSSKIRFGKIILPRQRSLMGKGFFYFSTGVLISSLYGYLIPRPDLHRAMFSPYTSSSLYLGAAAYITFWFFIQEILIQQAKYLWNDIRDRKYDSSLPANDDRIGTKSNYKLLKYHFLIRLLLGFVLAYILSEQLFLLSLFIICLQVIYEFFGKTVSNRYPVITLFIVAPGSAIRLLSGFLAAGWLLSNPNLILYFSLVFIIGIIYVIGYWKAEAEFLQDENKEFHRGQSAYFLKRGDSWISSAILAGFLIYVILLYEIDISILVNILKPLGNSFTLFHPIVYILIAAIWSGMIYFIYWTVSSTFRKLGKLSEIRREQLSRIKPRYLKKKHIFVMLIVIISLYLQWIYPPSILNNPDELVSVNIIFITLIMIFFFHSDSNYEKYAFKHTANNFRLVGRLFSNYFFNANSSVGIIELLTLMIQSFSKDIEPLVRDKELLK